MSEIGPLEYFICGGFGGICTVLVGHPLDTIKVRLQTMPLIGPGKQPIYSGTFDCARKTIAYEGIRGLYKGMGAPLFAVVPIFAISFMGYGIGMSMFKNHSDVGSFYFQHFIAGALSGVFTTLAITPGERIKCLLQIQYGGRRYTGPLDCAEQLYKDGGIRSVYKGSLITLMRDVPSSGMYFLTYETVRRLLYEDGNSSHIFVTLFAGGAAGIANWVVGMPPDVIKSRLQTAPEGKYPNGIRDVFSTLVKYEGLGALYKGFGPVLLRAFPANAVCFLGFEFARKCFDYAFPRPVVTTTVALET